MPGDLEDYLRDRTAGRTGDNDLREIAAAATNAYMSKGVPLNESLRPLVKEAGLNLEQIRRVVEHANVGTNLAMFRKGFDKNITFPVADTAAVADMSAVKTASVAYAPRAPLSRTRYVPGSEGVHLSHFFGPLGETEKVASMSSDAATARLAVARREARGLNEQLVGLGVEFEVKLAALRTEITHALETGDNPLTVGAAIEMAGVRSPGLLEVLGEVFGRDVEFGGRQKLAAAGMMMMPGTPVTGLTQDLDQLSAKMMAASGALERTRMAMGELTQIMQGPPVQQPTAELFQQGGPPGPPMQGPPPQGPPMQGPPPGAMPPQGPAQ